MGFKKQKPIYGRKSKYARNHNTKISKDSINETIHHRLNYELPLNREQRRKVAKVVKRLKNKRSKT